MLDRFSRVETHRSLLVRLAGASLAAAAIASIPAALAAPPTGLTDLAIGNIPALGHPGLAALSQRPARPAILIAWRNSAKVLEVETLLENFGVRGAQGRLQLEVLDAKHFPLAHQPAMSTPFVAFAPAASRGGDSGVTVQIPGSRFLNRLLDSIDLANEVYCIRMSVVALGLRDVNPLNNLTAKCYNNAARLLPDGTASSQYFLRNLTRSPVVARLAIRNVGLPAGWRVNSRPHAGSIVRLAPGAAMMGLVTVTGPSRLHEGDFVDIRPTLATRTHVVDASEFYVAADSMPPAVNRAFVAPGRDRNHVYLNVRAIDRGSSVAEASGAAAEWSTDGRITLNQRVLTYVDGNFLSSTGFDTQLGPFPIGTKVELRVRLHDVVGNNFRTAFIHFRIPLKRSLTFR
jgi:hypothetical protein